MAVRLQVQAKATPTDKLRQSQTSGIRTNTCRQRIQPESHFPIVPTPPMALGERSGLVLPRIPLASVGKTIAAVSHHRSSADDLLQSLICALLTSELRTPHAQIVSDTPTPRGWLRVNHPPNAHVARPNGVPSYVGAPLCTGVCSGVRSRGGGHHWVGRLLARHVPGRCRGRLKPGVGRFICGRRGTHFVWAPHLGQSRDSHS